MILKDKVIIITGAATGLGKAFSLKCAAEGAKVVCADIADCQETGDLITKAGGDAICVYVDISKSEAVDAMCKSAEEAFGGIDGIVNNASHNEKLEMRRFDEIDEAEWDKVMAVNAKGTWLCCKAAYPYMIKRGGGSMVNISSALFLEGSPFLTHYLASKAAIWAMSRNISRTAGEHCIRCNSVTLGFTMTESVKKLQEDDPEKFQTVSGYALSGRAIRRMEEPEDVVGGVTFLLSDESAFVTGQNLNIDGGCINY